ncbi:MAG: flagellar motor protein MotB [Ferruginibacter sp.]|nr:flagellar motor protein MotB [Ferruginibacter sp.]
MKKYLICGLLGLIGFSSCVSKKVLKQSQLETANLRADSAQLANQIAKLQDDMAGLNKKITDLNNRNSQLGQQTANQQSQLSESEKTLQQQQKRLQQLQTLLAQQRSQSEQLKNKMSEALKGFNSNELTVLQKNGKVYVSLSENLLFPSGSAVVNPKGVDALSKLAAVLNLNADVSVNIEGHTDSIPIRGRFKDNWDLSTARANSIVRILVDNYRVDPVRVIASGHSFFDPLDTNSTPEGRAKNRRTEIILSPKLDEMYKLLEM